MRKLFKKSLACVLAVALCLTAMVGAMVVSADTIYGTIAFEDVTIKCTDTDATIPVTFSITSETDLINVAYLNVAVEGADITGITAGEGDYDVVPNTALSMFEVWFNDNGDGGALAATANIAVSFTAGASFTVTVSDNTSASNNEQIIEFGTLDNTYTVNTHGETAVTETVDTAATCTEAGSKTVTTTCTACSAVISTETVAIEATGHTDGEPVIENQVNATCTENGSYETVTYCTVCDAELSRVAGTTDALGHDEAEAVIENNVDATCTTEGSYDTVVYCTVCNEEISRETTTVDALGHNYVDGTCTVCGEADPDYEESVVQTIDDVFPYNISYDSKTFASKFAFAFTGNGESKVLNDWVIATYGVTTNRFGVVMSIDGTDPTFESHYGEVLEYSVATSSKFQAGTAKISTGTQYYKMNIKQFATDVKFSAFITYIDGEGVEQYVYTTPVSAKLIDYINENATEGSLESKLAKAYEDSQTSYGVSGSKVIVSDKEYAPFNLSYNLDTFEVSANYAFVASSGNSVTCTDYVNENYGPITNIHLLFSLNGTEETLDTADGDVSYDVSSSTKFKTQGAGITTGHKYFNMNITQMGQTYAYTFAVTYEGGHVALETVTINLMDILRTVEGNDAVTNIVEIYDMLNS